MLRTHFFFLFFALCTVCIAGDLQQLPGAEPIVVGKGKARQDYSRRLRLADLDELHTRVIYHKSGLVPPHAQGVVILIPGTSGNILSEYSLKSSMSPLANQLAKRQLAPLAFQPPIYWKADQGEVERAPFLQQYGTLAGNMNWLNKVIDFVIARMPLDENGNPTLPLYLIGRSTGAALGMQSVHQYLLGDTHYDKLRFFKGFLFTGVSGHTESAIETWHQNERRFYFDENPLKGDKPVILAAPEIFRQMQWQTHAVETHDVVNGSGAPRIFATLGARDEFVYTSFEALADPIMDFALNHPQALTTLMFHDGHHDPSREIKDASGVKRVESMERMKAMLDTLLGNEDSAETNARGAQILFMPHQNEVQNAIHERASGNLIWNACLDKFRRL